MDVEKGSYRAARTGVGIQGMRERVRELGGTFEIQSGKQGTRVSATVPFQQPARNMAKSAEIAN